MYIFNVIGLISVIQNKAYRLNTDHEYNKKIMQSKSLRMFLH
jgi:hypothetical protein